MIKDLSDSIAIIKLQKNWQVFKCSKFYFEIRMAPSLPNLNPLDYSIWSTLEKKASARFHLVWKLCRKLNFKWAKFP